MKPRSISQYRAVLSRSPSAQGGRASPDQIVAIPHCGLLLVSVAAILASVACSGSGDSLALPEDGAAYGGAGGSHQSEAREAAGGRAERTNSSSIAGGSRTTDLGISIEPSKDPNEASASDPNAKCGSVQVDAQVKTIETVIEIPGNVLFVFDQSDSMGELWQGKQKWKAANDAVVAAFTPLQEKLSAGAVLFPMGLKSDCDPTVDLLACILGASTGLCPDVAPITTSPQMQIQPGKGFLAAWTAYWSQGASMLELGTPTEKALLQAETALGTARTGNTAVVLVTDGMPTCGSNESTIAARLLQKNIKTYVVGLPGGTGVDNLDKIAIAGGTAPKGCSKNCYLTPVDVTEFQKSLQSIATTTVTTTTEVTIADCTFQLTPPTDAKANGNDVHLIVTQADGGEQFEVPRTDDAWTLSADATTATLLGVVCNAAKTGLLSSVSFQYGCVTVPEWRMPLL